MLIIPSPPAPKLNLKKPLLLTSFFFILAILIVPLLIALAQSQTPTGTYLNPLPQNQLTSVSPTPSPQPQRPEDLILTAQAYLEKAINLSQKTPQTPSDREEIISLLNQSLTLANQAVAAAPNAPESYLVRARILASSASLRPDATQLAQKDLETAQRLSQGQKITLPTQVDLFNLAPTQQAILAQDLIIAAPEDAKTSTTSAQTNSNITKLTATLPAGHTQTIIKNPNITPTSYIYLINPQTNHPLYLQSKTTGAATIATTKTPDQDLAFEYWLVNP